MSTFFLLQTKKIRTFWKQYGRITVMSLSFILTAVFSFELGYARAISKDKGVLIIKKPVTEMIDPTSSSNTEVAEVAISKNIAETSKKEVNTMGTECVFVGSKNSNKYHLPSCQWAKRIKLENRVCFSNKEEAEKRGYVPGCIQ